MDDMNAFDRQLASVVLQRVGPSRPVDDAAIFTAITATQSPKWRFQSMFSATKFVVAGAIVALFGGFLLSGVLTQQGDEQLPAVGASASAQAEPSDAVTAEPTAEVEADMTTRTDLLPGVDLVTEEVEPGVYRVISDGVRELSRPSDVRPADVGDHGGWEPGAIVAGADGSVWYFRKARFFRLGDPAVHDMDRPGPKKFRTDRYTKQFDAIEVGSEGTIWDKDAFRNGPLRSFDGEDWSVRMAAPEDLFISAVEALPDGSAIALTTTDTSAGTESTVARLDGEDWVALGDRIPGFGWLYHALSVGDEGEIWLLANDEDYLSRHVYRYHDGSWLEQTPPGGEAMSLDVNADGVAWVTQVRSRESGCRPPTDCDVPTALARFDGTEWAEFDGDDGVPEMQADPEYAAIFAAPDGSVWVKPSEDYRCDGIANFDGQTLTRYLAGLCVHDADIGPDGAMWLLAGKPRSKGTVETYVIAPAYAAATE